MVAILFLVFEHAIRIFFAINHCNKRKYTGTNSSPLLQSTVTDKIAA